MGPRSRKRKAPADEAQIPPPKSRRGQQSTLLPFVKADEGLSTITSSSEFSTVSQAKTLPRSAPAPARCSCLLCNDRRYFAFKPRSYPLFEDVLSRYQAQASQMHTTGTIRGLWMMQWYRCPFCVSSVITEVANGPGLGKLSQDSLAADLEDYDVEVKEEDNTQASMTPPLPPDAPPEMDAATYVNTAFDVQGVSPWLASKLIAKGYPPDICFSVARNHNLDIVAAERTVEDVVLGRLEQAQMTLAQNESKERATEESQLRYDSDMAQVQAGYTEPLTSIDAESTSALLHTRTCWLLFNTPSAMLNVEDNVAEHRCNILMDARGQILSWMKLKSDCVKWYKEPSEHYFSVRRAFIILMLRAAIAPDEDNMVWLLARFAFVRSLFHYERETVARHLFAFRPQALLELPPILRWGQSVTFPEAVDIEFIACYLLDGPLGDASLVEEDLIESIKQAEAFLGIAYEGYGPKDDYLEAQVGSTESDDEPVKLLTQKLSVQRRRSLEEKQIPVITIQDEDE